MFPKFTVESDASEAFARKATAIYDSLFAKVDQASDMLANGMIDKLEGPVLRSVTGRAVASVHTSPAAAEGDIITGIAQAGGREAPYLVVQEYGGRDTYEIVPINKKALAFPGGESGSVTKAELKAGLVIVKRVMHPPLPERSFARTTADEMRAEIVAMLEGAGGANATVEVL